MRTPSLRGRLTWAGIGVVALLVLVLDAFVFFSLRDDLQQTLDEVLDARLTLAAELAQALDPPELDRRLTALGIPAVIRPGSGQAREADPATNRFQIGPPAATSTLPAPLISRSQTLPDGTQVTVFASRAGVDQTLENVLLLEIIGSVIAVALSVILLQRVSTVVLRPIDRIVTIARRIAAGEAGGRLHPDREDTELGRMAAAFDHMLDAMEDALDDARSSARQSRRFLADAAHQLRTPVAGLRATVETLIRTHDAVERDRLLDNLGRETSRMSRLVDSLLRVARLDQQLETRREPVRLDLLAEREIERAQRLAPSLRVELDCHDEARGLWIEVERDSIAEAVTNLLDNARRHADAEIVLEVARRPGWIELTVSDDGPGLPPQEQERAFDRFVSLDTHGGAGLGLPIARAIAEAHGGTLDWMGEAFRLRLPDDLVCSPSDSRASTGPANARTST